MKDSIQKTIFVTNHKPEKCQECTFYTAILSSETDETTEPSGILDVTLGCGLTHETGGVCPLYEDKEYIDRLEKEKADVLVAAR